MSFNTDCPICAENYTSVKRKYIVCPNDRCNFSCCSACLRTYLLDNPLQFHCMSCRSGFTYDFLTKYLPKSYFTKEWAPKQEEALYEREKALLPSTQALVESKMRAKQVEINIKELNNYKKTLREQIRETNKKIAELMTQQRALEMGDDPDTATINPNDRRKFIMPCPRDVCRGYLSTRYKCGLCEYWVCKHCHEVKGLTEDSPHTCNPNNVASVSTIKHETKSCPACGVPIYKLEGCSQMWCSACHIAFDWRTGRVVTGNIHNPHYTEWRTQNENNSEDNNRPCGDLSHNEIRELSRRVPSDYKRKICNIIRILDHINDITIGRHFTQTLDEANTDLRVKYMMGQIDEKEWKRQLRIKDKKNNKDNDIRQLLHVFVETGKYILKQMTTAPNTQIQSLIKQLEELRHYTNYHLYSIAKRYSSTVLYQYSDEWNENKKKVKDILPPPPSSMNQINTFKDKTLLTTPPTFT